MRNPRQYNTVAYKLLQTKERCYNSAIRILLKTTVDDFVADLKPEMTSHV